MAASLSILWREMKAISAAGVAAWRKWHQRMAKWRNAVAYGGENKSCGNGGVMLKYGGVISGVSRNGAAYVSTWRRRAKEKRSIGISKMWRAAKHQWQHENGIAAAKTGGESRKTELSA